MNVRGDAGIAESAEQNGVEFAIEHGKTVGRDGHAVGKIAVGAPVEIRSFHVRAGCGHGLNGFRNDLFANAVAGNNSNAFS